MRHGIAFERMQAWLDADNTRARFYAAISRKTQAWARERGRPKALVADALAMAVALHPDIVVRSEHRHVAIELTGAHTRGATVVDWESRSGSAPNAHIVLDVDHARFEALVASALT
jgi:purine nucleosidase